jgi:putative toxin-antitoxin system antitoxin component (TIGR02293 family)
MGNAAAIPASPPPFTFDWREIERGLPLSMLEEFSAYSGIPVKNLLEVVIPPRTLKHRRQRKEPLNAEESDRLARVAKMYELAVKVYGNAEDGKEFLIRPMPRFDGGAPIEILRTEAGEEAVQEFLVQIDEGMYI